MGCLTEGTLVRPEYRLCSGRRTVEGVEFLAYSVGVIRYASISADGKCMVQRNHKTTTYSAWILLNGERAPIYGGNMRPKRFRTEGAAMVAAVRASRCGRKESA